MLGSFSGFRKHLKKAHGGCLEVAFDDSGTSLTALKCDEDEVGSACDMSQVVSDCAKSIVNSWTSVMTQLIAAGLGQVAVNSFVTSMEDVTYMVRLKSL